MYLVFLLFPGQVYAACTVATTSLAFGVYDVFNPAPTTSTSTVSVSCTTVPPPDVVVAIGPSPSSGGFSPRAMRHAILPALLNYNVFSDAAGTVIWGDGGAGTSTVFVKNVRSKPKTVTLYGRIPPLQSVSVGLYSDTLTVTITP